MAGHRVVRVLLMAMCGAVLPACNAEPLRIGTDSDMSVTESALLTGPIVADQSVCGLAGAICVNFQRASTPVPAGYLPDTGGVFGSRNGRQYGWNAAKTCVDRDLVADQRLDTFCRPQPGDTWEIALPNGTYHVRVAVGDAAASANLSVGTETVFDEDGEPFALHFYDGASALKTQFLMNDLDVPVSDGRLTLFSDAASGTPINFVEIIPAPLTLPAPPAFDATKITKVSAYSDGVLALLNDGSVWTWGSSPIFTGIFTAVTRPRPIVGLTGIVDIDAAGFRAGAVKNDGTFWIWGSIAGGNSGFVFTRAPLRMVGVQDMRKVAMADGHALLLDKNARIWAFGDNDSGQLGTGTFTPAIVPVKIDGITGVVQIAAANPVSRARTSDGGVWSAGSLLGNGTINVSNRFIRVAGLPAAVDIAAGDQAEFVIAADGTAFSWGAAGFLCSGPGQVERLAPTPISSSRVWAHAVAVSGFSPFALLTRTDGTLWSCGDNQNGTLGDGTTIHRDSPVRVGTLTGVRSADGSPVFAGASTSDGHYWTWGFNTEGQFGNGTTGTTILVPLRIF
jgi:alpha-tubulin suppressor-like RCC1 family protein